MGKKTYKVWAKISVEEIDEDRDICRDVTDDNGKIVEDVDPPQESFYESTNYAAAKEVADKLMRWLCDENPS